MPQVEARALHIAPVDACEKSTSGFLEWRICSAVTCVRALAILFELKGKKQGDSDRAMIRQK